MKYDAMIGLIVQLILASSGPRPGEGPAPTLQEKAAAVLGRVAGGKDVGLRKVLAKGDDRQRRLALAAWRAAEKVGPVVCDDLLPWLESHDAETRRLGALVAAKLGEDGRK